VSGGKTTEPALLMMTPWHNHPPPDARSDTEDADWEGPAAPQECLLAER